MIQLTAELQTPVPFHDSQLSVLWREREHISAHMTSVCASGCQEMQVFVKTEQLSKVLVYVIKVLQIL